LDKHEPSHEGKRRDNRHNDPDKTASEDGLEETREEKEGHNGECGGDDFPPVNRGSVRNRDGCVVRELFGERGWVETAGEIVLGGIRLSASGLPGPFSGGVDRYDRGGHEVQLDGGVSNGHPAGGFISHNPPSGKRTEHRQSQWCRRSGSFCAL